MSLTERFFTRPERNVGRSDFGTRVFASIGLAVLIAIMVPAAKTPFSLIKIALLSAAEVGLVSLMLGLFLRAKTYFAGAQLFAASLIMLWLEKRHMTWAAIVVGALFLALGVANLMTRRSRLNQVLGVSSFREVIAEVAKDVEDGPVAAALQTQPNGGPR